MAWKDLATGLIDKSQRDLLDQILQRVDIPCLLRVAVLHHHALPIAFSGGITAWRAPALILRNAGTMLHKFQLHHFDLVLHGHEHVHQLARLELPSATGTPYPLTVLGAASACLETNQPAANSLSEIEVESNGRLSIRTRFYGVGGTFARPSFYSEPLPALLSRAFVRARERHRVECSLRTDTYSIDDFGNLWATNRIEGLALRDGAQQCEGRPVPASIPAHGRLALETAKLDAGSRDRGLTLLWRDRQNTLHSLETATPEGGGSFWVRLPQPLVANAPPLSFEVHRGSSNCINMSRWEARQRQPTLPAGVHWDEEFVGSYIRFPTARLILKLQLPDDLNITPRVQCRRHLDYPAYEIVDAFDAAMPPSLDQFVVDEVLQRETARWLGYDARERTWCLDVEHPLVGHAYELHWQVPGRDAEYEVATRAEFHHAKLSTFVHSHGNTVLTGDTEAPRAFRALAEGLAHQFRSSNPPDPDERQIVMWMTYDKCSSRLQLRPVLEHRSWASADPAPEFVVPLGHGVAGAAFLQRRTIVWGESGDAEPFIEPVRHPLLEDVRYAMALPIFLQDPPVDDGKPVVHTSTGAVIGIVSIHSNSMISGMAKLLRDDPEIRKEVEKLQVVVQAPGQAVLEEFHQRK